MVVVGFPNAQKSPSPASRILPSPSATLLVLLSDSQPLPVPADLTGGLTWAAMLLGQHQSKFSILESQVPGNREAKRRVWKGWGLQASPDRPHFLFSSPGSLGVVDENWVGVGWQECMYISRT